MAGEIAKQVEELFSDKDQWDSFLELSAQINSIKSSWWQEFREKMNKCFVIDNPVGGWMFLPMGIYDYRWYLKDSGEKSLCLWNREWYGNYSLALWADRNLYDIEKISKLLQEQKYLPIVSAFERQDEIFDSNSEIKLFEHGNYHFGDPMDGHLKIDNVVWYAHYKSDELVSQILKKIDRFRKDKEITSLLSDINRETKKS
jgi:hypothetical protein